MISKVRLLEGVTQDELRRHLENPDEEIAARLRNNYMNNHPLAKLENWQIIIYLEKLGIDFRYRKMRIQDWSRVGLMKRYDKLLNIKYDYQKFLNSNDHEPTDQQTG
jgi:hypothetical protein